MRKSIVLLFLASSAVAQVYTPASYNADVAEVAGGKRYRFHASHVNYRDGASFKRINTWLSWDGILSRWGQNRASYNCSLPKYADDWIDFTSAYLDANISIKARPVAAHAQGILHNGEADGNYVLYPDAFGTGIDLRIYAEEDGLKKVVVINKKPSNIVDMTFDFELDLPSLKTIRDNLGNIWDRTSGLDFTDRTLMIGDAGKELYFREALLWDSAGKSQPVKIKFYRKLLRVYLRKTVPAAFLENATYPVYTDHPTSYYSGAGDGYVEFSSTDVYDWDTVWDATHNATTGTSAHYTGAYAYAPELINNFGTDFSMTLARAFYPFDTSAIPDGATVTAATLNLYCKEKHFGLTGSYDYFNVVQTSQASTSSLTTSDYDNCGAVHSPTVGASNVTISTLSTTGYTTISLNSTGLGWISKTGYTKLGLRVGRDLADASPIYVDDNDTDKARFYCSEQTGTDKDPYLEITVSEAPATGQVIIIN